ncbi:hypothetical protein QJQ45_025664 [Haematococcus lacustris]|nr:hypothetical protein QJQ45_025664 [Haematococcus lacustris]
MSVALLLITTTPNTQPMGALGIAEGGPGAFPGAPQQLLPGLLLCPSHSAHSSPSPSPPPASMLLVSLGLRQAIRPGSAGAAEGPRKRMFTYSSSSSSSARDSRFDVSDINTRKQRPPGPRQATDPWWWSSGTLDPAPRACAPAKAPGTASDPTGLTQSLPGRGPAGQTAWQEQQEEGALPAPPPPHTGLPVFQANLDRLASCLVTQQQRSLDAVAQAVARAQRQQHLGHVPAAHQARVALAEQAAAARQQGGHAIAGLQVPREAVEQLWRALKAADREGSGKVTIPEFTQALGHAGVKLEPAGLAAIVGGLRDNAGLLAYADLSRSLLLKSRTLGSHQQEQRQWQQQDHQQQDHRQQPQQPPVMGLAVQQRPRDEQGFSNHPGLPSSQTHWPPSRPVSRGMSASSLSASARGARCSSQPDAHPKHACVAFQDDDPHQNAPTFAASAGSASGASGRSQSDAEVLADALAKGRAPLGCQVLGPSGARYFTYKGRTLWFAGNDTPEALAQAAAEYATVKDLSHDATLRLIRAGCGDGGLLDPNHTARLNAADAVCHEGGPCASMAPTISSQLKTGALDPQVLAAQMDRGTSAPRGRPQSATQSPAIHPRDTRPGSARGVTSTGLVAAVQSGRSLGGVMRSVVPRPGMGAAIQQSKPQAPPTSFTSVANRGAGSLMARLQKATLREEVAAVRTLM